MDFRVLGPVQVWQSGGALFFPRRQQRLLLGILAIEANHLVPIERLIDLLWADRPPTQARAVVQTRVSELRAILGTARADHEQVAALATHGNGYTLQIDPDLIDAHRFRKLVLAARSASSDEHAREALRSATALWHGPALGGWLPRDSHTALCHGLESERITAMEDLFDVELRLGRHFEVVDEIVNVFAGNPDRERTAAHAMLALHRAARTPEALQAYQRHRLLVGEELGIDPSSHLQELYLGILRADPALTATQQAASGGSTPAALPQPSHAASDVGGPDGFQVGTPQILPGDIPDFTGRDAESARLIDILTRSGHGVAVAAVAGPAGVGKTALSVRVAHRLRDRFPHGQLYADLHGIERDHPPTPGEILARFLRALGVESGLPDTLDDRTDMYRGLLAGRQVLVVLDNAADADQVKPLIPGSPTCAVLVNSRTRLAATLSGEGINLDILTPSQAVDLLCRIAGRQRIELEPHAAAHLADLCGGLPLAIRVAAARLVAKPHWTVQQLVDRLADERQRLNQLSYRQLDVRSSIGLSYSGLAVGAKRLLCRLGDIDVPEVNVWCSGALLDAHPAEAEETLEQLHDAQLIDIAGREGAGYTRYRLHDLVRLYAKERAVVDEDPHELEDARRRAFGAWLFVLDNVRRRVIGDGVTTSNRAPRWPVDPALVDAVTGDPMRWLDIERQAIVEMIRRAARSAYSETCWGLADAASPLLEVGNYYDEWVIILAVASSSAQDSGDLAGQATVHFRLGTLAVDQLAHERAREHFESAARLFHRLGDLHGHAVAITHAALVDRFSGNRDAALRGFEMALPGIRAASDHLCEALTLRNIGQVHLERSEHTEAEAYFADALKSARLSGSRRSEAQVYVWLGMLRRSQQRHDDARELFMRVLDTAQALGDRFGQAQALRGLGLCHQAQGDFDEAAAVFIRALPLVRHPVPTRVEMLLRQDLAALEAVRSESSDDRP